METKITMINYRYDLIKVCYCFIKEKENEF